jgi:hypothetical protein
MFENRVLMFENRVLMFENRVLMFENRVLRKVFGPKRDEVTGEWRRLNNGKLNDLYSSLHVIQVIKQRRMRWTVHLARMEKRRCIKTAMMGKTGRKSLNRCR